MINDVNAHYEVGGSHQTLDQLLRRARVDLRGVLQVTSLHLGDQPISQRLDHNQVGPLEELAPQHAAGTEVIHRLARALVGLNPKMAEQPGDWAGKAAVRRQRSRLWKTSSPQLVVNVDVRGRARRQTP